jgi:hypothetical protein
MGYIPNPRLDLVTDLRAVQGALMALAFRVLWQTRIAAFRCIRHRGAAPPRRLPPATPEVLAAEARESDVEISAIVASPTRNRRFER